MFEIGDTILCVNDKGWPEITKGRVYKVIGLDIDNWPKIKDDNGAVQSLTPYRFVEVDPTELPTFDGNTKDDEDKLMGYSGVDLYFPRVLDLLANLSQGGAEKYAWEGWASVEDGVSRYRNAEWRHRQAIAKGEDIDEDISRYAPFPVRHEVSRIWNLMAALELELRDEDE